jgi:signal transduction histidine kinase
MDSNAPLRPRRAEQPGILARVPVPPRAGPKPVANGTPPLDERLQRLDRLASVGTMSASLAHEIKNAMVAIRTFIEMLLASNKDAELAGIVKRELLRIDSIVSQMLRFSANPRPSVGAIRLNQVLEQSLRLIEPQLNARGIRLKRDLQAEPDTFPADAHRLEQAFTNVFLNAIEAIGHNGEIAVATSIVRRRRDAARTRSARAFQITIHDTGVGISKEDLALLFEPFFTTKPNGTGLGLPITRDIIQQQGGTISVKSEIDRGTTFCITLPLANTPTQSAGRKS